MSSHSLEALVPRLPSDAEVVARDDGSEVLFCDGGGVAVEIAHDQAGLLAFIDGQRTVAAIIQEHFSTHGYVPFQALIDLLARLRAEHALLNSPAELEGLVPNLPVAFVKRVSSMRLGRWSLARFRIVLGLASGAVVVALIAAVGLTGRAVVAGDAAVAPDVFESPLRSIAAALLGCALALLGRTAARAAAASAAGAWPRAMELRLHFGVPTVEFDPAAPLGLGRSARMGAYAAALGGSVLAAWVALVVLPAPWAEAASLGAWLVFALDACPFAPGSMGQLLAALARKVDLRDHARSYLSRRYVVRMGRAEPFAGENVIILTATLSLLWCVVMLDLALRHTPEALTRLFVTWAGSQGAEAAAAVVAMLILSGLFLAAVFLFFRMGGAALMSALPQAWRNRPRTGEALSPAAGTDLGLKSVPIFSALPESSLRALTERAQRRAFRKGDVVVRQGDVASEFFAISRGTAVVELEERSGKRRTIARLQTGDCFGELALLKASPRTATVRAETALEVVSLTAAVFQQLVASLPGVDLTRMIRATAALHQSSVFRDVAPERLAAYVSQLEPVEFGAGAVVFQKGDPGDYFYVIDSGSVYVHGADDVSVAKELGPGDHFGEVALLRDTPRNATVRAAKPTTLWRLSTQAFYGLIGGDLQLSTSLERAAQGRVQ